MNPATLYIRGRFKFTSRYRQVGAEGEPWSLESGVQRNTACRGRDLAGLPRQARTENVEIGAGAVLGQNEG